MSKPSLLRDKVLLLNRFYFFQNLLQSTLAFLTASFIVTSLAAFALFFFPQYSFFILSLGVVCWILLLSLLLLRTQFRRTVKEKDFALSLEVRTNKPEQNFLQSYNSKRELNKKEEIFIEKEIEKLKENCRESLKTQKKNALLSFLFCALLSSYLFYKGGLFLQKEEGTQKSSYTLTLLKGSKNLEKKYDFSLAVGETQKFDLKEENLIQVSSQEKEDAQIILLDEKGEIFQTILLEKDQEKQTHYSATFSLTKSLFLSFDHLASEVPLAYFTVEPSSRPQVFLSSLTELKDPWPSNEPISLQVDVLAQKELSFINLHIKSENKTQTRELAELSTRSVKSSSLTETLYLDQFLIGDFGKITLQAEAVDLSSPNGKKGFSNQLLINLISVYGQYKKSLTLLKEIREDLSHSKLEGLIKLSEESSEKMEKVAELSKKTPYYDYHDRKTLKEIEELFSSHNQKKEKDSLEEALELLTNFLSEHETLDDRERDRDFFVAMRSLSYLIEEGGSEKQTLESTKETREFLDERFKRWQERTRNIPDKREIPSWESIEEEKTLQESMEKMLSLMEKDSSKNKEKIREILSKTVSSYEDWITELEKAEDKQEEEKEQLAEKQLISIREQLNELKKRQDEVSSQLDESENTSSEELNRKWPLTRLKQNTNLVGLNGLIERLKSLNFSAGKRLDSAKEAMEQALQTGEEGNFKASESFSDTAGRYLREAVKKSEERQKRNRNRRRKHTGSQEYHGQAIHRGDIEIRHDYEIDKQYREEILKEFESNSSEEHHEIQERYLKKIIR